MSKVNQWIEGELDWFDELSGKGFIRDNNNQLYFVHKTAFEIPPTKISINKKLKFKVYEDILGELNTLDLENTSKTAFIDLTTRFNLALANLEKVF